MHAQWVCTHCETHWARTLDCNSMIALPLKIQWCDWLVKTTSIPILKKFKRGVNFLRPCIYSNCTDLGLPTLLVLIPGDYFLYLFTKFLKNWFYYSTLNTSYYLESLITLHCPSISLILYINFVHLQTLVNFDIQNWGLQYLKFL